MITTPNTSVSSFLADAASTAQSTINYAREGMGHHDWNPNAGNLIHKNPEGGVDACIAGVAIFQSLEARGEQLDPNQIVLATIAPNGDPLLVIVNDKNSELSNSIHQASVENADFTHQGIPGFAHTPSKVPTDMKPLDKETSEKAILLNDLRELPLDEVTAKHLPDTPQSVLDQLKSTNLPEDKHFRGHDQFNSWCNAMTQDYLPSIQQLSRELAKQENEHIQRAPLGVRV